MGSRTHVLITREGWYYIAVLGFIVAGAVIRDINLLYIMAGMMLGPLLLSAWLALQTLRRLDFSRRFARTVSVGDLLVLEVVAAKVGKGGASFLVTAQDRLVREGDGRREPRAHAKLLFTRIPAGGQVEAAYRVRVYQRGRYRLGPLKISTSMPVGLIRAAATKNVVQHVLVSPRLGRLLPAWSRRLQLSHEGGQRSQRRRGKTDGDFYGIRDWRTGDGRNWIHWRTSAKRNKLSVRQFEQRINQDLAIVLDLWQPTDSPPSRRAVELAVSFAATLAVEHGRHGATHLLVASASRGKFLLKGTSSSVFQQELMERLAVVDGAKEDRLPEVMAEVLPQVYANSRIVLASTRACDLHDTERFAEVWRQPHLRRLMSEVVCVDVGDAEFTQLFRESEPVAAPGMRVPEPPEATLV